MAFPSGDRSVASVVGNLGIEREAKAFLPNTTSSMLILTNNLVIYDIEEPKRIR